MGKPERGWEQAVQDAYAWLRADRLRLITAGALGALVLCAINLILPWVFSTVMALMWAVIAGSFILLGVATWLAGRMASTDTADVWDADSADDRPEDLFSGFAPFRTYEELPPR